MAWYLVKHRHSFTFTFTSLHGCTDSKICAWSGSGNFNCRKRNGKRNLLLFNDAFSATRVIQSDDDMGRNWKEKTATYVR